MDGIGPSTSVLSGQRSTTELHAQNKIQDYVLYQKYNKIEDFKQTSSLASDEVNKTKNHPKGDFLFKV